MSTTQNTLATFAKVAEEVWEDVRLAEGLKSVAYTRLAIAKPVKDATADQLYGALPKAWRESCSKGSFAAQLSLAGRIVSAFLKAKAEGRFVKYADPVNFVAEKGSLDKAKATLIPAKVEGKKSADPKAGGESKAVKVTLTAKDTNIDPFAQFVELIDQFNEVDLKTALMLVQDRLAKFEAKALVNA